jgi:hypothetical protein
LIARTSAGGTDCRSATRGSWSAIRPRRSRQTRPLELSCARGSVQHPDERSPELIPEPPVEGLPPKDKPIADYTEEEWAATHADFGRTMRERAKREERERREAEERFRAEVERTDDQRFGDLISASLAPRAKQRAQADLIRSLYGDDEDEKSPEDGGLDFDGGPRAIAMPEYPEADHNEIVADFLLRERRRRMGI